MRGIPQLYGGGGQATEQVVDDEDESEEAKVAIISSTAASSSSDINNNNSSGNAEGSRELLNLSSLARTRQHLFNSTNNRNYAEALFPCGVFTSEELFRLSRGRGTSFSTFSHF